VLLRARRAGSAALLAALVLVLATAAAPARAADVVVGFDDAAAVPGQSANEIYRANPGLVFGAIDGPEGGSLPVGQACGLRVDALAGAPSAPNVATVLCNRSNESEANTPPLLIGKLTSATRTRVSMRVGDTGSARHVVQLSAYDGEGRLVNQSQPTPIPAGGTVLTAAAGQPEITYFVLAEVANDADAGLWIDDVTFDTPAIPGRPSFGIEATAGTRAITARQGTTIPLDVTLYRINGSDGNARYDVTGLPPGVTATASPSVNGQTITFRTRFDAPATDSAGVTATITATPADAGAGTVVQRLTVTVRVTPAISLVRAGSGDLSVPDCSPIQLVYDVAADAGPATWGISALSSLDVTIDGRHVATNGVPVTPPVTATGRGTATLQITPTSPLAGDTLVAITLLGGTSDAGTGGGRYRSDLSLPAHPHAPLTASATSVQTPRELRPGTTIRLSGDHLCTTATSRVRFGNDLALAPITSSDAGSVTAEVPRLATSGTVQLVPDASLNAAGKLSPVRIDGPALKVDDYRDAAGFAFHNYTPSLTLDQMTAAYGHNQVYFTPNVCHAITLGLLNCRVSTPIPDPWALAVLQIANLTMGGGSGGACFGIARTSQQILRGRLARTRFGNDAATNAFELGMPGGAGGRLQETINANHLQQLSADYLDYYADKTLDNVLNQTNWQRLRTTVEGYLRRGDDPLLSLRDGGSVTRLHVVVGYDIENDPSVPGAYWIDVYDSNKPFSTPLTYYKNGDKFDETAADGADHQLLTSASRIHVLPDNSWSMPSSGYGGRTVQNIVVGGLDNPPAHPQLISASGALKQGFKILFGWAANGVLNARASTAAAGGDDAPSTVTQITSGKRRLYSAPGVINADPATALRAAPWAPATDIGDPISDDYLLAAGPGASYSVALRGDRDARQTRTLVGDGMVATVKTQAKEGVTDKLDVAGHSDRVGFSPGRGSSPLDVQMMVRAGDGSTRTVEAQTTTPAKGSDAISLDRAGAVHLDHSGPAATVKLTLSGAGSASLPQAATAKVRVGRNARATLKPASWTRLAHGRLVVRSKGRTSRVTLHATRAKGAKLARLTIAGGRRRVAHAKVTVPSSVTAGTATVTYVLRRGRRVVASSSAPAGGKGTRTLSWSLPAKARRGDRLVAVVTTVVAKGSIFSTAVSRREARLRR
jgi:hypothetical protein